MTTCWSACAPVSPASPASSATRTPSCPRSSGPSWPATTWCCSASAGRARPASIRSLAALLDEWTPVIAGSELNEHPFHPITPAGAAGRPRRRRRPADRLAAPLDALRREAGHPGHQRRRPDRRRRPDPGRRGPHARRPRDHPLRPRPAHQPWHLRGQRAARPRRAHPGVAAQRPGGARHPGPRLPAAPAARPAARGQRQPGGLHEPRAHHHPAQGPLRRRDPHALPARPGPRDRPGPAGGEARRRGARARGRGARPLHPRGPRVAGRRRPLRRVGPVRASPPPRPWPRRPCAAPGCSARPTRWPGSATPSR